jgi:hypothetical protein
MTLVSARRSEALQSARDEATGAAADALTGGDTSGNGAPHPARKHRRHTVPTDDQ